jgi:hypothetical protein
VLGLFTAFSSGVYMSVRSNPSFGREMSILRIVFQLRIFGAVSALSCRLKRPTVDRGPAIGALAKAR